MKSPSSIPNPAWETWCVVFFSLGFLALNLLTGTRYPFVWIDEVMYSDPAVNLYLGHGFTSSAWYVQHANEFWAGNVPLHSFLLYLWMKLFGFSILAVRSINYVYLVAAALLFWRACIRLNLVTTSWARLLLLGLIMTGYSMVFAYRSGRPDCLALLLVCAVIYVHSRACWRQRIFGTMALGALMPWAGLQLLPLLAVGGCLLFLYLGRKILPAVLATWTGVALGGAALAWFYVSHGVLDRFLLSIRQHTTVGFFGWLGRGELRHSNLVPKDFSFMVMFALAVIMAVRALWRNQHKETGTGDSQSKHTSCAGFLKSPLSFGLVYSLTLTVALILSGKFPTYYGWMTYVPLCLCVCMALSHSPPGGIWRWICGAFLAGAMGISLALNGVTAAADWSDRDYSNVEKLLRENVNASDWLYGEHAAYYAAKRTAARTFMPLYLSAFLPEEKQRLTVLIITPKDFDEVTNVIGGNWISTGKKFTPERNGFWASRRNMGFLSMRNYELEVYRRDGIN
ncbi:MAG: hypothetical protein JWQ04_3568 [Pedosphaera sp.]|nr:hypothetical protein [Pedosphaera sp.]